VASGERRRAELGAALVGAGDALAAADACVTAALTQLTFIDAAGLRALVQARMLVHGRGGQLTLHGARPLLRRMLEITELDTAFDLESDLTTPV